MAGILLALLNPFFAATQNVVAKNNLLDRQGDWAVVFYRLAGGIPILGLWLFYKGWPESISHWFWVTVVIMSALEMPSQWFYHQAIKQSQISLVLPVSGLLVLTMSPFSFYFFGGWSWLGFSGVLITCFRVYILHAFKGELPLHQPGGIIKAI